MSYEDMSLSELKEYAKNMGIPVGNSGKAKLVEKIKEKEVMESVISDDDLVQDDSVDVNENEDTPSSGSLIDSISNAIYEID